MKPAHKSLLRGVGLLAFCVAIVVGGFMAKDAGWLNPPSPSPPASGSRWLGLLLLLVPCCGWPVAVSLWVYVWFRGWQAFLTALATWSDDEEANLRHMHADIENKRPFVLYLRNHAPEKKLRVMPRTPESFERAGMTDIRPMVFLIPLGPANPTEDAIVKFLAPRLQVYALMHEDSINPGKAKKVRADTSSWLTVASKAMDAAALIVLVVSKLSPGVTLECKRIDACRLWGKVWLLASKEVGPRILSEWPDSTHALAWETADLDSIWGASVEFPERVAACLNELT